MSDSSTTVTLWCSNAVAMPDLPVPRAEWSSTCRQRLRKRWDHVMTVTLLGAGAVFSGVAIFKIGILEEL